MINSRAAAVAINIAEEFDKRGLALVAKVGTPIAALDDTVAFRLAHIAGNTEYVPDADMIELQTSSWGQELANGQSEHSIQIDAMADQIAKYVRSHLNFAKNTVVPIIKELADSVSEDIMAANNSVALPKMKINIFDLPEPLQNPSVESDIVSYKDVSYYPIRDYMNLPEMSGAQVIESMTTGASSVDDAIVTWAAKLGDSFFKHVYDCTFTANPVENNVRFNSLIENKDTGIDAATAVFLLTNRLINNPPEGTAINLSSYNDLMDQFRKQSALLLNQTYEKLAREVELKILVKTFSNDKLLVNGTVYRQWIESGGIDAVLFGSLLSKNAPRFVDEINEQRVELLSKYEQHMAYLNTVMYNNRFVQYKNILKNRTLSVVSNNFTQCFSMHNENIAPNVNMPEFIEFCNKLDEFKEEVNSTDFEDIYHLSLKVICRCVFFRTDAEKILYGIQVASKLNPKLSVQEAGLLSLIQYVTDFVADQMQVSNL